MHFRMQPARGEIFPDLVQVYRVHDNDDIRLIFLKESGIDILLAYSGNKVALHMRINVADMIDGVEIGNLCQEADRFGSAPPHDDLFPFSLETVQPFAPFGELQIDLLHKGLRLRLELFHRFFQRMTSVRRSGGRAGFNEKILAVVFKIHIKDLESAQTEEAGQRARTKIGAVLVENIPERLDIENTHDAGHFKKEGRCCISTGRAYCFHKPEGIVNMLECMATCNAIGLDIAVPAGVKLLDETHIGHIRDAARNIRRIDPDTGVVTQLADQPDKVPLAAADLNNALVANTVFVDKALSDPGDELNECGRKTLLILIPLRVIVDRGIKHAIEDESARIAEGQHNILTGNRKGLLAIIDRDQTLRRRIMDREEIIQIRTATTGTNDMLHLDPLQIVVQQAAGTKAGQHFQTDKLRLAEIPIIEVHC